MEALRNHARILAIVAAAAILAVFAAPGVRADVGKPTWAPGDFWEYSVTGSTGGASGNGTLRWQVVGVDSVTVAGVSYPTYHAKLWVNISQGSISFNIPGDVWFRQSDLSPVKGTATVSLGAGATFATTITFNPPNDVQWPLTPGKTWNTATQVTTVVEYTGQPPQTTTDSDTGSFQVQASQTITVPAGTFDSTALRDTHLPDGDYEIWYWSAQTGSPVKQESYDSNNQQQGSMQLTKYNYQGAGLGAVLWILIILVIVIIAAIAIGLAMRKRKRPAGMPPSVPGQAWQQPGWPQQPPQGWQPPPQQPWQPPPQGPP